jgi:serine/threonine-protein kinase
VLVANLLDRVEVFQVVAASLRGAVSLVPLDQAPDPEGAQIIELHAPGLDRPILLLGRAEGEPIAGMFPLRLKPLNATQAGELRAFLRVQTASQAHATQEDVQQVIEDPSAPGRYGLVSRRPAQVEIPRPPEGAGREPPMPVELDPVTRPGPDTLELVFGAPDREDEERSVKAASLAFEDTLSAAAPAPWQEPDTLAVAGAPVLDDFADRTIVDPAEPGEQVDPEAQTTGEVRRREDRDEDHDGTTTLTEEPPRKPRSEPGADSDVERLVLGRTLGNGRYVVESLIGSGGAGRVYRARHVELDTRVAIKILHARHQRDDRFTARFRREARATSKLDHPNVMRVLDSGREDDGLLYIVMEHLDGQDLQRIIDLEAPLPVTRIVGILTQVCAALTAAHEIGIIHRDVKPENVIVMRRPDDDGTLVDVVKVCDFGLAKIQEPQQQQRKSSANLTLIGTIWGTPEYMSPEQIRDELIDPRSDVYACGVILYEMATARLPFIGETALEILTKHVTTKPDPPSLVHPSVPPRLESVILKALAKDREQRQQSARELRAELRGLLEQVGSSLQASSGAVPPYAPAAKARIAPLLPDDGGEVTEPQRSPPSEASLIQTAPRAESAELASELADRLVHDPPSATRSFREMLDAEKTLQANGPLELALVMLATQGEMRALWQLVAGLDRIARDREGELQPRHRALATRALQALGEGEALGKVAHALLDGPAPARAPAREVLSTLGVAGARALCTVRLSAPMSPASRGRFVAVLREMGSGAIAAIGTTLSSLETDRVDQDPGLVEDLLRAVPDEQSEPFGQVASRFLKSRSPAVRRAAVAALILSQGAGARERLALLFDDPDEGVRIACLAGLRRLRAVDPAVVRYIDRVLAAGPAADEGLVATAVAALGGATDEARPEAIAILSRLVEPAGLVSRLVGSTRQRRSDFVIETAARALVAIDGPGGRQLVARCANREKGTLRDRLRALVPEG